MAKNDKKKSRVKPNKIAWCIYATVSYLFTVFQNKTRGNRKAFKKRNKNEGCLVMFNHGCKYDHFYASRAFGYTPVSYVVSTHFCYNPFLRWAFGLVHAIPKEQFKADINAIMKIKRTLQSKTPVALSPAGQITMHGESVAIDKVIVKLFKMCNVDVYALQMHGTYFAYPKWRKYRRHSPIRMEFVKVLSKEEIKTLTDEEIYQRACASIDINDRLEQPKYNYKLKSKGLIEGLESIIYRCPSCKEKNSITTSKDILSCDLCGYAVKMNSKGLLESAYDGELLIDNESNWYRFEKEYIKEKIQKGDFFLDVKFDLYRDIDNDFKLDLVGSGRRVLTEEEFYYEGTLNGEVIRKDFNLKSLVQLPFESGRHFDIPDDEGYFEFKPVLSELPSIVIEYVQAIDVLANIRNEK